MPTIELSKISGKIVGYELGDDDTESVLKVRDASGKVHTAHTTLGENESIPSGNVDIVTTIQFEEKKRDSTTGPNVFFGANGQVLIDSKTKLPFVARTGPTGRDEAEKARLDKERKANGGEPKQAIAKKFKAELAALLNGAQLTQDVWEKWNHSHPSSHK